MRGGYDLNGRYYPNAEDAINAEMAQVAEIDARYALEATDRMQQQMYNDSQITGQYLAEYDRRITELEDIVKQLQEILKRHGTE